MADIIDLSSRMKPGSTLIIAHPLEFRKGEWLAGNPIICTREESSKFESHRKRAGHSQDRPFISLVPSLTTLDGGHHFTAAWLYRFR